LNAPSCRQHLIARSKACFNNCATQTTRTAGDKPYLRHSSSCISKPTTRTFYRSFSNSGLDARTHRVWENALSGDEDARRLGDDLPQDLRNVPVSTETGSKSL